MLIFLKIDSANKVLLIHLSRYYTFRAIFLFAHLNLQFLLLKIKVTFYLIESSLESRKD